MFSRLMEIAVQNAIVMGHVQDENGRKKYTLLKRYWHNFAIDIYLSECFDEYCSDI
ncbi:MAG: hypothetical protein ACLVKK_08930 [Ruthenibacterium sp.]